MIEAKMRTEASWKVKFGGGEEPGLGVGSGSLVLRSEPKPICLDSLDSNFGPLPESACYSLCGRHFRLWLQLATLTLILFSWRAHPHPSLKWRFQIIAFVHTSFLYLSYLPPQPSVYLIFIYLWLRRIFHCCVQALSSWGEGALLFVVVVSLVQEHGL